MYKCGNFLLLLFYWLKPVKVTCMYGRISQKLVLNTNQSINSIWSLFHEQYASLIISKLLIICWHLRVKHFYFYFTDFNVSSSLLPKSILPVLTTQQKELFWKSMIFIYPEYIPHGSFLMSRDFTKSPRVCFTEAEDK